MAKVSSKTREEARRLFLTGEIRLNSEIAARLAVKAHTVGLWRRQEDWDGLLLKIDRRAAQMFVEKIATDRVTLNVRHFRYWEVLLAKLAEELKAKKAMSVRDMDRLAGILERAQRGQRVAKGMSANGETEEGVRAQAQAEIRRLIDAFIESVKENVADEETRDRIRRAIFDALPQAEDDGTGEPGDEVAH
ncbi:MAG TPA: hypothetical protein VGQ07_02975 [Nitrospirales bacterium]|jgi:uncharacterized protein YjcR|nr:hypothetical protein [Nitrospirales bacterium]